MLHDEGRPAANGTASMSLVGDETSLLPAGPALSELDALADHLTGYFVVQVVIDDDEHRRTHLYRSAGAAQRAVERARQRGRVAHVSLCQLLPIGVVRGLEWYR